ncbi:hypothetical protein D3C78_1117700 [compost metagenome]
MQRKGQLVFDSQLVYRGILSGFNPLITDSILASLFDHFWIVRIKEQVALGLIQILLIRHGSCFLYTVSIIQQHAKVADTSCTGFGTNGWKARFDSREAKRTFFRLIRLPVEIHFFVRTACHAISPAAASLLVYKNNTVLVTFIHRTRRARSYTARVQAMFAKPWQIHHKSLLEIKFDLFFNFFDIRVFRARNVRTCQVVFPVRSPLQIHVVSCDHRFWTSDRLVLFLTRVSQVFIIVIPRLIIIFHFRHIRVVENFAERDLGQFIP